MISDLLRHFPQGRRNGVSNAALDAASTRLGFEIPAELRAFYRETNGLVVHERRLALNDFEKAVTYATALGRFDIAQQFGLFPLTESNDSNPYCIACKRPIVGHIIHVQHDDAWRLAFRNVDQFALAVLDLARAPNWIIDDLTYGYATDHTDRTLEDDIAADAILDLCRSQSGECDKFVLIALSLYSRNRVDRVIGFLADESMWTREEAAIHLGNMGDVRAIEPLQKLAESQAHRQDGKAAQKALKNLNRINYCK